MTSELEAPGAHLITTAERAVLALLRSRRPMSTTMLVFHLQESAGSLVPRLKGMRDQGWVSMAVTGTPQRPALEWTATDAGVEIFSQTDEHGRRL